MARGTLMIIGSGEISPGMVKVYRSEFSRHAFTTGTVLDTPYGFQENVPQLTAKICDYFSTSLHLNVSVATFLRDEGSALTRTEFAEAIRRSPFVFAGPGSPSYAIKQWHAVPLRDSLLQVLESDGVVCFASAAALTLGTKTAPIYELYKVGDDPFWIDGVDVMSALGLRCVVIPHFDNAEGGNHDTRFCYLGERRLTTLESMLDSGVATLGVDEHTVVTFDLASDSATVRGRGHAYWRHGADTLTLSHDAPTPLDTLRNAPASPRPRASEADSSAPDDAAGLGAVAADGGAAGLRAIAELIRRAEQGSPGHVDPAPLVEGVLRARTDARKLGQYAIADELRDALESAGIEVRDTSDGAQWALRESSP
jgi:hypothetical protein